MTRVCERGLQLLEAVYNPSRFLFPYTTDTAEGVYHSDYGSPRAIRYTINTLLGLQAARNHWPDRPFLTRVPEMTQGFFNAHWSEVTSFADQGLLLLLLSEVPEIEAEHRETVLNRIANRMERKTPRSLHVQDVGWALWGMAGAARCGISNAREHADRLCRWIGEHYLDPRTGFPRYSPVWSRRDLSSFGGITYCLRALYEYGSTFGDEGALDRFRRGVRLVIALQGPQGEWPWITSARRHRVLDFYPVYSVHQHSMAFLFLFPALDLGVPGVAEAVEKSYRWVLGHNQFSTCMVVDEPFLIHRCMQRRGRWKKLWRALRCQANNALGHAGTIAPSDALELNPECRSYEIGWLLYVWAGREDFAEFTELRGAVG